MELIEFIKNVLLAFEQSSSKIRYDKVYMFKDGPEGVQQITLSFGITEYGNLQKFIREYCLRNGAFSSQLSPYISKIGKVSLVKDAKFVSLLKESAVDPIMQQCQEDAFEKMYIDPAILWCSKNQLNLPLSKLVVADSFLHSGSILTLLRDRFAEKVPVNGGDEKMWIESYCKTRKSWLENHSNPVLPPTAYRMKFMLDLINMNDWSLSQKQYNANGNIIKVS